MIKAFSKIFAVGSEYINSIFHDEVEITEKIDGSQFDFGKIDSEFYLRSKGQQIFPENPDKMFQVAVDYVLSIQDKIPDNTVYYCEYLRTPRHNTLSYERTPKNNLILFGVSNGKDKFVNGYEELKKCADKIKIETVPLIFQGKIEDPDSLLKMLEKDSVLGNTKIEGVVVKNYYQPFLLGGQPIPLMAGKFVSEKFKEVHKKSWGRDHTSKGKWQTFKEGFRTEARWDKAIQHLRDSGELENDPRDIGKLIMEIQKDIGQEEKEAIKNFLWKEFGKEVLRYATSKFPEYYKEKLLKDSFEKNGK